MTAELIHILQEVRAAVPHIDWQKLYEAAMLEMNPDKLVPSRPRVPGSGVTKVSPLTAPCPICNVTDTLLPTALMNVTPFSTITLPLVNDPWNSVVLLLEFVMSIMPPVKVNPPVTAVRVPVVRLIVPPAG